MTAVTRGPQSAERKVAAPAQEQGATAKGDAPAVSRRTNAEATASSRAAIRGRLAERMAEIAGQAKAQTQAPPQTPAPPQASAPPAPAAQPAQQPQQPRPKATAQPSETSAVQPVPQRDAPTKTPKAPAPRQSLVERLRAEHQLMLRKVHERVLDAPQEQLFFVPTKDPEALSTLTISSPNRAKGHDYHPVPCKVFDWALAQVPEDLSGFTFVDYGAGKGRAMLLAAEHAFAAVAGVEFAAELHDNAEMNIAQYPRSNMRCRNVECVLEDAVQVGPPEGPSVHYFFNPFEREVFAEVLNNIVMAYRRTPRRLYLILIDPVATDLVDASGVFARVEPSQTDDLKLRLLSPHTVAVYRSLA